MDRPEASSAVQIAGPGEHEAACAYAVQQQAGEERLGADGVEPWMRPLPESEIDGAEQPGAAPSAAAVASAR